MERTYDIFEMVEDAPFWRTAVKGHFAAIEKAEELSRQTPNEIRVINVLDKAIIAVVHSKNLISRGNVAL